VGESYWPQTIGAETGAATIAAPTTPAANLFRILVVFMGALLDVALPPTGCVYR
jgi:hypothetical protein